MPDAGVRTPDLELSAEREKEPVAGYAPKSVPMVLVTPMAMSSWFGLILYPLTRPKAERTDRQVFVYRSHGAWYSHLEMAMCSSTKIIVATGSSLASATTSSFSIFGGPKCWKPRGTLPKILIGYLPAWFFRWRQ